MPDPSSIPWVDIIGYMGGAVTLWSMHQKTMIPLRIGGIAGNIGFIAFGLAAGSNPTFILHALLAPLNTYRMIQMMRLIKSGNLLLEEINQRVGAGDVLGEIGAFTPENRRTCTAVCETDCELYVLSHEDMIQLFYQNPRFGFYLVRIIVRRLLENWHEAEGRTKALA